MKSLKSILAQYSSAQIAKAMPKKKKVERAQKYLKFPFVQGFRLTRCIEESMQKVHDTMNYTYCPLASLDEVQAMRNRILSLLLAGKKVFVSYRDLSGNYKVFELTRKNIYTKKKRF